MKYLRAALLGLGLVMAWPALAVTPDEVLADPVLEARAREISAGLRCMVCQNQSIDDSDADLARDLRVIVRERLLAGDTNEQVFAYLVARYGEFVLLKPVFSLRNALLWSVPAIGIAGGLIFILAARRRRATPAASALSDAEKAELETILSKRGE